MSQNTTFRRAADRIRQNSFVLPIFLVFLALLVISIGLNYEDYWTSYHGYLALPTKRVNEWVSYLVGGLPQVGQIAAGYIVIALFDQTEDRNYLIVSFIVWIMLFLIDSSTDVYYKTSGAVALANPDDIKRLAIAVFEAVGIYTLGAELSFVVGFGMVVELIPDTLAEFTKMFVRIRARLFDMNRTFSRADQIEAQRYQRRMTRQQRQQAQKKQPAGKQRGQP